MASPWMHSSTLFAIAALMLIACGRGAAKTPAVPTPSAPAPAAEGPMPVAPGPTAEPLHLVGILRKELEFKTLIRMLKETQIGEQIDSQLNNSYGGVTLFAPTDSAFNKLKPGTMNSLTGQQQVALLLYHILPRYFNMAMFQTTSNPVNTQATGNDGVFKFNITSSNREVNISTGIMHTPIGSTIYSTFPLAIYKIDAVLLPYDLFGPNRHVPAAAASKSAPKPSDDTATVPSKKAADSSGVSVVHDVPLLTTIIGIASFFSVMIGVL